MPIVRHAPLARPGLDRMPIDLDALIAQAPRTRQSVSAKIATLRTLWMQVIRRVRVVLLVKSPTLIARRVSRALARRLRHLVLSAPSALHRVSSMPIVRHAPLARPGLDRMPIDLDALIAQAPRTRRSEFAKSVSLLASCRVTRLAAQTHRCVMRALSALGSQSATIKVIVLRAVLDT
jgi:hypothetical protein